MVIDYRERRQVTQRVAQNRPKRKSGGLVLVTLTGIGVGIFCGGVATGWFLHGTLKKASSAAVAPATSQPKKAEPGQPVQTAKQGASHAGDEPLSFYYTLPKGEKAPLGSGLNPQKVAQPAPHQETKAKEKQVGAPSPAAQADSTVKKASEPEGAEKQETKKSKYTVQVASCSSRKEAEALKASLEKNGFTPHVFESRIPGKGTWYRVRLGNGMDMEAANRLAAKVGSGAAVMSDQ